MELRDDEAAQPLLQTNGNQSIPDTGNPAIPDGADEPLNDYGTSGTGHTGHLTIFSLVLSVLPGGIETALPRHAGGKFKKLRLCVGSLSICLLSTVVIFAWLFCRGMAVYLDSYFCHGSLHTWLLVFLALLAVGPWVMPLSTILLIPWSFFAMALQLESPDCSRIESFVSEALWWEFGQLFLLICAGCGILVARSILRQLYDALNQHATSSEVLDCIKVVVTKNVPGEETCPICLGGAEEEQNAAWRQLKCEHRFHEPCLFTWLETSHGCPVCRADLHKMYGEILPP